MNDYLRNEDVQDFGCKNRLPPAANFVFAFPTPAAWFLCSFALPNSIREHKANAFISEDTKALAFNLTVEITESFSIFCVGTPTLNRPHP